MPRDIDIDSIIRDAYQLEGQEPPGPLGVNTVRVAKIKFFIKEYQQPSDDIDWSGSRYEIELVKLLSEIAASKTHLPTWSDEHSLLVLADMAIYEYEYDKSDDDPDWEPDERQEHIKGLTKFRDGLKYILSLTNLEPRQRGAPKKRTGDLEASLVDAIRGNGQPQAWMYRVVGRILLPIRHPDRREPFTQEDIDREADRIKKAYRLRSRGM